ncbi:MAG: hypothetical protein H0U13_07460 [Gemmatimonadaceae bacterium]|nr:hypothetical protein [Gemmatimonadaceae bacterium]
MQQTDLTQQQNNPTQQQTNPTSLTLKLVTGDTHTVHPEDYETVINAVGDAAISMIAFHDSGRRVYVPCRAIVSMVESVPSETQAASTWAVVLR